MLRSSAGGITMAREPRLTSYGETIAGAVDLDEHGSQWRSYRSTPSMTANDGLLPDDPIPIFLSGQAEAPEQPNARKALNGAAISSRILKAGILTASVAAVVFAFLSVDNPLALFTNAKASLPGTSAGPSSTPSTPAVRAVAVAPALPSNDAGVASGPTRDEIAAALRAA